MEEWKGAKLTVQGFGSPVPAANGGVQAGPGSSSSYDRSSLLVDDLAGKQCNTTSEDAEQDPFRRSSLLLRSPPRAEEIGAAASVPPVPAVNWEIFSEITQRAKTAVSQADTKSPAGNDLGPPNTSENMTARGTVEKELQKCKAIISKMKAATDRQRNISMEVKKGLAELQESMEIIETLKNCWDAAPQEPERLSWTDKSQARPVGVSPLKTTPDDTGRTPTADPDHKKRAASSPIEKETEKKKKTDKEAEGWTQKVPRREHRQQQRSEPTEQTEGAATASSQRKRKRKRKPKIRPDAILIKPMEGRTYAEILREIRSKAKPEDTETDIKTVRQTRTGGVLLELGVKSKDREGFSATLKAILGEKAVIRSLEPRITLEIRDLDNLTTEEEVQEAIKKRVNDLAGELRIFVTKPNSRAQKMAIVQMNARGANELLETPRIKIGWINCRVRQRVVATRCFRCFGYGHQQRDCRGPDRKKQGLCIKCGEKGHKRSECEASAKCFLCAERKLRPELIAHEPGSGTCQEYREALEKLKNNAGQ